MIIGYIKKELNKAMQESNVKKLSDDDLKKVTGGDNLSLHFFDTREEVRYIFEIGEVVYVKETIFSSTVRCVIESREVFKDPQYNCYLDAYIVRGQDGSSLYTRVLRDDIVNYAD